MIYYFGRSFNCMFLLFSFCSPRHPENTQKTLTELRQWETCRTLRSSGHIYNSLKPYRKWLWGQHSKTLLKVHMVHGRGTGLRNQILFRFPCPNAWVNLLSRGWKKPPRSWTARPWILVASQKESDLPTFIFQGRAVELQGCTSLAPLW